jgi:predicted RNA-binding protein with PUA-like domain
MNFWLLKSEPEKDRTYAELVEDGRGVWRGVRNYQARNFLREMAVGDLGLMYHSGKERQVAGVLRISRAAYQDPTTDDDRWVAVEVEPLRAVETPVTLATIKATPALQDMKMVRQSRLSVSPTTTEEFTTILGLAGIDELLGPAHD